ncbi:hypothetical protein ID866_10845 [Astraeus odoratus]|nr:hypothetical protein ID866_10845 [Astraeus odoratus]
MPAKAMIFDSHACLDLLAGFGNLAGKIDVVDRRTLGKITTIEAPNTSSCAWSACGRFVLTASSSPRLQVGNAIKIWHCTGPLIHVQPIDQAPAFG